MLGRDMLLIVFMELGNNLVLDLQLIVKWRLSSLQQPNYLLLRTIEPFKPLSLLSGKKAVVVPANC